MKIGQKNVGLFPASVVIINIFIFVSYGMVFFVLFFFRPDKKLHSKEERCRADPAYEIMESRVTERNLEVGQSKTL